MGKVSALLTLLKLRGPQTVDEFYKRTRQSIPSMRESAQKEYKQIADTILSNDDLYRKSKNDSLKDEIRSRIYNLSSKDNLSAYKHANRLSSYRDVMDYIKKKENRPRTRIFSDDELEKKYKPFHKKRGEKFTNAKLDEYNRKKSLDNIFEGFERYRESSAFRNFRGDVEPRLTKQERTAIRNDYINYQKAKRKRPVLEAKSPKVFTSDYLNLIDKSKRKLYPDKDPTDVVFTPEQRKILDDFIKRKGISVYKNQESIPSQQLIDAYNRASIQKYLNKPQKMIQNYEYDGTSFSDLMESIDDT